MGRRWWAMKCACIYSVGIWKWQGRSSGKNAGWTHSFFLIFDKENELTPNGRHRIFHLTFPGINLFILIYSFIPEMSGWGYWTIMMSVVHPIWFYNEDKERQFLDLKHHNGSISSICKAHVLLFEMFIWRPPVLMWKWGFLSVWFEMVMLLFCH